jgi:hypothetical protein
MPTENTIPLMRVEETVQFFGIPRNRILVSDLNLSIDDRAKLRQKDVHPSTGSGSGRVLRKSIWG